MIPRISVSLVSAALGEVTLVGDEAVARKLRKEGVVALGPAMIESLAKVAAVFPGSSVVAIRRPARKP